MKAVIAPDWLAEMCILSRVWARCLPSTLEDTDMLLMESLRDLPAEDASVTGESGAITSAASSAISNTRTGNSRGLSLGEAGL